MISDRKLISIDFDFHRAEALRLRREAMRLIFAGLFARIWQGVAFRKPSRLERRPEGPSPYALLQDRLR